MRRIARLMVLSSLSTLVLSAPVEAQDQAPSFQPVTATQPSGFVQMFVAAVITTEGGPAVVLRDEKKKRLLPIWVGVGEAHAIQLRLERKRFPRPLTHDLFDAVLSGLGGKLLKIHVDDLEGDTFIGTIFVRRNGEIVNFDARPSDSIALALGNHAPIFVAEGLLIEMEPTFPKTSDKKTVEDEIIPEFGIENPPAGIKTL